MSFPTTEVRALITFETAVEVVCRFAESELSGNYFSVRDVERLGKSIQLIQGKLNQMDPDATSVSPAAFRV